MIAYCEALNPESIKTGAISVDTASEFFGYISNSYSNDSSFTKDINKTKEIIEDSF